MDQETAKRIADNNRRIEKINKEWEKSNERLKETGEKVVKCTQERHRQERMELVKKQDEELKKKRALYNC